MTPILKLEAAAKARSGMLRLRLMRDEGAARELGHGWNLTSHGERWPSRLCDGGREREPLRVCGLGSWFWRSVPIVAARAGICRGESAMGKRIMAGMLLMGMLGLARGQREPVTTVSVATLRVSVEARTHFDLARRAAVAGRYGRV